MVIMHAAVVNEAVFSHDARLWHAILARSRHRGCGMHVTLERCIFDIADPNDSSCGAVGEFGLAVSCSPVLTFWTVRSEIQSVWTLQETAVSSLRRARQVHQRNKYNALVEDSHTVRVGSVGVDVADGRGLDFHVGRSCDNDTVCLVASVAQMVISRSRAATIVTGMVRSACIAAVRTPVAGIFHHHIVDKHPLRLLDKEPDHSFLVMNHRILICAHTVQLGCTCTTYEYV